MHRINMMHKMWIYNSLFLSYHSRALQTMPLALPPHTHPPKSPPLHQSAPVEKVQDNKTNFER